MCDVCRLPEVVAVLSWVPGVTPGKSKSRDSCEIFGEWLLAHSDNSEPLVKVDASNTRACESI